MGMERRIQVGPFGPAGVQDQTEIAFRGGRDGSVIVGHGRGSYYENTSRNQIYSLTMSATTTNNAAGNILGAAAAASTQFALWNPIGSGVNLSLLKFALNITSGTTPISGIWHSVGTPAPTIASALAATSYVGSNRADIGTYNGLAGYLTHATGAALTGGGATRGVRETGFSMSVGTYLNVAGATFMDGLDGDIVLPPNTFWVPSWAAAGTTMLVGYSITWEQLPI